MDHRPASSGKAPSGRVLSAALGLAGGMGVNALSDDFGYRGVAGATALAAVLYSVSWLRTLPVRAPLYRGISRLLLLGSACAAIAATVTSSDWDGIAAIGATLLAFIAVVIRTDVAESMSLLRTAGCVGLGVACAGLGVKLIIDADMTTLGAATIAVGVSLAGWGWSSFAGEHSLWDYALGLAQICWGVAFIYESALTPGLVMCGIGAGTICVVIALRRNDARLLIAGGAAAGVAFLLGGISDIFDGDLLFGGSFMLLGVALTTSVTGVVLDSSLLMLGGSALTAAALTGVGVVFLKDGHLLIGLAAICGGVGIFGSVAAADREQILMGISERLGDLVTDPLQRDTGEVAREPSSSPAQGASMDQHPPSRD